MKKFTLAVVILCSFIGLICIKYNVSKAQSVIDVDESNYRVPLVGGTQSDPAYEITRFDCPYQGLAHQAFGPSNAGRVLMDINRINGASDIGTPVYSSGNGTVVSVGSGLVQIENNEMGNYYGHLTKIYVTDKQSVGIGQLIGLMGNVGGGSTGPHLHWETYPQPGYSFDPLQIQGVDGTDESVYGGGCTSDPVDGYMWGPPLNIYNDCPGWWNNNVTPVMLFDSRDCSGNALYIPADGQVHFLDQRGFNDRVRSIYMHGDSDGNGISVLMGSDTYDLNTHNYCWYNDMWNTDVDHYFNSSGVETDINIGWDSQYTNGANMISWVQVFNNNNCSGLGNNWINNQLLSSIREPPDVGGSTGQYGNSAVDIREDPYCQSTQYGWNEATNGIFNLSPSINYMDDRTSCIDVDSGFSIMVYENADGLGGRRCFNHTVDDLQNATLDNSLNANDAISSVEVFTNSDCSGQLSYGLTDGDTITIWENSSYSGQSYGWHSPGSFNFSSFGVSAIGIMDGWSVLVYEGANQTGAARCFFESDYDLSTNTFYSGSPANDNIESITVFYDSNCSGWTPVLPSVWTVGGPYLFGQTITVNWSDLDPSGNDWISMHPTSDLDNSQYLHFEMISGSSGSVVFNAPLEDGSYDFRLFRNGIRVAVSNSFMVEATPTPTITNTLTPTPSETPASTATATPYPTGSGTGLTGEYYDNIDFTGALVTRVDSQVNFDWGGNAPDPSMGVDTFSVRWTGEAQPLYTENYTFCTSSDDGVRLWLDGQLIVDNWTDHAETLDCSSSVALTAGVQYSVQMEYYEAGGGAIAKFLWQSATQAFEIVPQSQLYPAQSAPATATPVPTETETPVPTETPEAPSGQLLSQGRPIVASTYLEGYGPERANDGSLGTYWEGGNNVFPASITVDLGAVYEVSSIVMKLDWGGRTENVTISSSIDDVNYTTIVPSADYVLGTVEVPFTPTNARYVRLTVASNSAAPAAQLAEFEVWGSDTVVATATSTPTPTLIPTTTFTPVPTETSTATPTPIPTETPVPTATPTAPSSETELLDSTWVLTAQSASSEAYQTLNGDELFGMDALRISVDVHGACLLNGADDNSVIIDQNGWNVIRLTNYIQNCLDGVQIIEVPLSDFANISGGADLNPTQSVGSLHARIWLSTPYTVEIFSIVAFDSPNW